VLNPEGECLKRPTREWKVNIEKGLKIGRDGVDLIYLAQK